MSVLADTPIWSLALRRRPGALSRHEEELVEEWRSLVRDGRIRLIGPIRQELLSGIRSGKHFDRLREHLADFDDIALSSEDYEQAARFFNSCRAKGITGGPVDLLICAAAHRMRLAVFTTDPDFALYARHVPLRLHGVRTR